MIEYIVNTARRLRQTESCCLMSPTVQQLVDLRERLSQVLTRRRERGVRRETLAVASVLM